MAAGRAELVYVMGPQAGQRASLMSAVVTVGRGRDADVQLTEEHVSRQHFRLTLMQDGWVFENLSPLRSRVNGKKYKVGKKIILDTGDVIAVGAETELLFVSAEDDTEAAVMAYRQTAAKTGKPRPVSKAPDRPEPKPQAEPDAETAAPAPMLADEEDLELSPEEIADQARKAKYKKYGMIFAAYIGVLAVVAMIIATNSGQSGPDRKGLPALLRKDQIDDFVRPKPQRDRNTVEGRNALEKAMLSLDRTNKPDHLYRAVYSFALAKAFGKVLDAEEERLQDDALRRLTRQVQRKYYDAYALERDRKYITAEAIFRELLDMLPLIEPRQENPLRENIMAHIAYSKRLSSKNKKR